MRTRAEMAYRATDQSSVDHIIRTDYPVAHEAEPWLDVAAIHTAGDKSYPLILYRGPGQRHRLRVIIRAFAEKYSRVDFVWLVPGNPPEDTVRWLGAQEGIGALRLIEATRRRFVQSMIDLRRLDWGPRDVVLSVNYPTLPYSRAIDSEWSAWFVQGAPEDRYYHEPNLRANLSSSLRWRLMRAMPTPDVTVAVSNPMAHLIEEKLPKHDVVVIPNSVADDAFRSPINSDGDGQTVVYAGSGAPWQGVSSLREVWIELHRLDPTIRFKVISRDERSLELLSDLPPSNTEAMSVEKETDMADALVGACAGFIMRMPSVASVASCPVKYAEYLAASVPVVAVDMDWDIANGIRDHGCGYLLKPDDTAAVQAKKLVTWLGSPRHQQAIEHSSNAARSLSDESVADRIRRLLS